ncbi:hypothetical protein ACFOW1_04010 [Parasediminibacterium paludis]|uniref:Uncharacterized protein n=1 Tax=Parasediminibacterium paludis TaxID=908966 RepID=A0ABV8PWJ0_9BACT
MIPLKGGGICGASTFLAITSILPFTIIFKFQSHFNFSLKYPVIILLMAICLIIMTYFDDRGNKIISQVEKKGYQFGKE